jgi:hypothetical protein
MSQIILPNRRKYHSAPAGGDYKTEVLADSPYLLWMCDDASGAPQDSSGNGRHGLVKNTVLYSQTPIADGYNCVSFGSKAGHFYRWTGPNLNDDTCTIGGLFNFSNVGVLQEILAVMHSSAGCVLAVDTNGKLQYQAWDSPTVSYNTAITPALSTSTRYHIVFRVNGTTISVFLNGTKYDVTNARGAGTNSGRTIAFGGLGTTDKMYGNAGGFYINESALSDARIAAQFAGTGITP